MSVTSIGARRPSEDLRGNALKGKTCELTLYPSCLATLGNYSKVLIYLFCFRPRNDSQSGRALILNF